MLGVAKKGSYIYEVNMMIYLHSINNMEFIIIVSIWLIVKTAEKLAGVNNQ